MPRPRLTGFTLLEAAVVLAVSAILLAVAVPNYNHMRERQRMRLAAETLQLDLQRARVQSSNAGPVFLSFKHEGEAWCWGSNSGSPCDCFKQRCNMGSQHSREWPGIWLVYASDAQLEAGMRAIDYGPTEFSTKRGGQVRVELNALGRASLCGKDAPKSTPC
ncbi:prepilin-type N-terminal cleavage/methylation domain-containing protein [Pelomonas sp. V22]|uniref:prepilin-type N-terminal cleavage/methylation domain-containing protein n=1 Tax=Pelomonas sp. V22 TaxID=2822139 RepID=UPI0024A7E6DD|nr:prepilin-type N-terminal cleavage/methylation domain-containing protein [Pelomonas sp. V22]MDI4633801.1 prepilin-type N-terminal cleavage/methylation domain-containing protein [Pelomonas sp. V22]